MWINCNLNEYGRLEITHITKIVLCVIESFFTEKIHVIHFSWFKSECSRNHRMLPEQRYSDTTHRHTLAARYQHHTFTGDSAAKT